MGYGIRALKQVEDLLAAMANSGPLHVLELGAQELNFDIPPSAIFRFIYRLNPDFRQPDQIARLLPGCFAAAIFRAANVNYACIDLFDAEGVVQVDLNRCDLPDEHRGQYDLVTNMGTTEHIFNQARAFQAIHDATKAGGIMFHVVPANGWFNHGLIKYEPKFFLYLAHANNYEILHWGIARRGADYMPLGDAIPGSDQWVGTDLSRAVLGFLLRKRDDARFVQPSDVDLRYVPADFPDSIRAAATPSTPAQLTIGSTTPSAKPNSLVAKPAIVAPYAATPKFVQMLEHIEARCDQSGLGIEPYALAASMLTDHLDGYLHDMECGSPEARQTLDRIVCDAATQVAMPRDGEGHTIDLGLGFLGTGWGRAGGDVHDGKARHFRALGPSGQARLFVRLPPGRDYHIHTLLYDARPGDAAHRLRLHPATDDKIEAVGSDYWHRCRLAKEAISAQSGLVAVDIAAGEADKISLQRIIFEPIE
jgi:SAM-dependent methyltransferase